MVEVESAGEVSVGVIGKVDDPMEGVMVGGTVFEDEGSVFVVGLDGNGR